jgi:hypothetical protein
MLGQAVEKLDSLYFGLINLKHHRVNMV